MIQHLCDLHARVQPHARSTGVKPYKTKADAFAEDDRWLSLAGVNIIDGDSQRREVMEHDHKEHMRRAIRCEGLVGDALRSKRFLAITASVDVPVYSDENGELRATRLLPLCSRHRFLETARKVEPSEELSLEEATELLEAHGFLAHHIDHILSKAEEIHVSGSTPGASSYSKSGEAGADWGENHVETYHGRELPPDLEVT
jgi:hypothetical protein